MRIRRAHNVAPGDGRWFAKRLRPETRQGYIVLCVALWSVISFLLVSHFLYSSVVVVGSSMSPTLQPGDRFILNLWFNRLFAYQRGDLVVLRPDTEGHRAVKRIIALPSETIQLREDGVYVNGRLLRESYTAKGSYTHSRRMQDSVLQLGPDEYFVMGDNRFVSLDSRWFGPVRRTDLLGTVIP